MKTHARQLRELLKEGEMLVGPGSHDCMTARAIERHGFKLCYMSGGGTSFAHGYPDYGLITMTEMVENAGRIANSINIPLISDADTGYGNELNVTRTVREFEQRGVAGIHIEDQIFPKRCGHLTGKKLISIEDYTRKIRAAVDARRDDDFVIVARTDARSVNGFDDSIKRGNAALAAGADVVFVEAPQTMEEVRAIPKRIEGPCMLNIVWNSRTPDMSVADARAAGFKIAIASAILQFAMIDICEQALQHFNSTGLHPEYKTKMDVATIFAFNGAPEWDPISEKFGDPEQGVAMPPRSK